MGRSAMTAKVLDFNVHALQRLANRAVESGNPFESYCLIQLIDGYKEGLWSIEWERGEPIFHALITQEQRDRHGAEKINEIKDL